MSLRARIFIVISLIVLAVLGISIVLLVRSKNKTAPSSSLGATVGQTTNVPSVNYNGNFSNSAPAPSASLVAVKPTGDPVKIEQAGVVNLAKIFVERYNTYSTDNNYINIKEIKSMVTPSLWNRLSAKIGTALPGSYVGVVTEAIGATLNSWTSDQASVTVDVAQTTEKNETFSRVNKSTQVSLKKINGSWFIDSFVVLK